jgi:hypothetical protein
MGPKNEPVMYAGIATVIAALAGAYGLDLTADQIAGAISVISVIVSLIARRQTVAFDRTTGTTVKPLPFPKG